MEIAGSPESSVAPAHYAPTAPEAGLLTKGEASAMIQDAVHASMASLTQELVGQLKSSLLQEVSDLVVDTAVDAVVGRLSWRGRSGGGRGGRGFASAAKDQEWWRGTELPRRRAQSDQDKRRFAAALRDKVVCGQFFRDWRRATPSQDISVASSLVPPPLSAALRVFKARMLKLRDVVVCGHFFRDWRRATPSPARSPLRFPRRVVVRTRARASVASSEAAVVIQSVFRRFSARRRVEAYRVWLRWFCRESRFRITDLSCGVKRRFVMTPILF